MSPKILVIRFGSLGDLVLCSSPLLNTRISFPGAHITLLTKECFREVARMLPGLDQIVTIPDHASAPELSRILLDLDRQNFTHVLDLHGNLRSLLARKVVGGAVTAQYPKRRMERNLIVATKTYPAVWPHTIDLYNKAVEGIGGKAWGNRPVVQVPELAPADEPLVTAGMTILIAPGAAHPPKQWPLEQFAEVAHQLVRECGYTVLWAATDKEPPPAAVGLEGIVTELRNYPIPRLAAIMSRCRVVLANDSGLMHLASAVGTPVTALFGPTHPALGFAPRGLFDQIIETNEPCRPCSLHGERACYRSEQFCFTRIGPASVADRIRRLAESEINTRRALFIDRDGTLIVDKDYLRNPDQIELIPGAVDALRVAQAKGYKLVVLSNQSGVARGYFGEAEVRKVNARLRHLVNEQGVALDGLLYCPHHERGKVSAYARRCACRKPSPGMAEQAAREHGIDLRRSVVIGDKLDDLFLGAVIGARGILVRTGYGQQVASQLSELPALKNTTICENLPDAIREALVKA